MNMHGRLVGECRLLMCLGFDLIQSLRSFLSLLCDTTFSRT
jgi:hypothetical protein